MKNIIVSLLLLLCGTAASVAEPEEYSVLVGDFTKIKVVDPIDVVYKYVPDSVGYAFFQSEAHGADVLTFSNSNGTLRIELSKDADPKSAPVVYVSARFLAEVENSSTGTVTVLSPAPAVEFKATVVGNGRIVASGLNPTKVEASIKTGNGNIVLSGECQAARFNMLGTGVIQADELKAQDVSCRIMGSGQIGCWPVVSLQSKGIGSTKIYYKGEPERLRKSGGGKLLRLDSADVETLGQEE